MSESEEHRWLVTSMADKLFSNDVDICISADLRDYPTVPKINGYRPDIYGYHRQTKCEFICEAKTFDDLKTPRSGEQIANFLNYLERKQGNVFVIGGIGRTAQRAKTILRFYRQTIGYANCSLQVFDGLDFWTLDRENNRLWRLC